MKKFMYLHLKYDTSPGHGPSYNGKVRVTAKSFEGGGNWIEVKNPTYIAGLYHRKFFTSIEKQEAEL